nr:ribonuclease H-like domain-containing protein [Tanacetum cinerariifolium]
MSLDDLYNHLKVYESEVQKKSELNSQNMAFISSAKNSSGNKEVNTANIPTASTYVSPASANSRAASIKKKISIQGTDVAGFDKSKVECFNCHKMGHFSRECRAPKSQDRGRRDNYRQGSKVEEQDPKALMAIDGDLSWKGFPKFADDTATNYSRPSPAIESTSDDLQNRNPSVTETGASPSNIVSKPFIKFVKATDSPTENKADNVETVRKTTVKYAELYRKTSKKSNVREDMCLLVKEDARLLAKEQSKRNARTPQENGVAERKNKTLIEAARTMLADAKLPITFWAKAVNTACYVQNRVLVNKSQNKTPYELFNGRTHAIGFLKPFGCHVMTLNTLDNLRKFEAKGDEDFLENKPIEKGADPNWLFDINSLTKFMNNVPVVVAGTNSTNFLGTKEVAGQEVKKDMSSLRYIVLLNWFHEVRLEASTSNAQDAFNTDAPETSRNSNPTATLTNSLADHKETLAVETPIPNVSSLVPTACLNDSPKPLSDTRLIAKSVTSQDDTPSLNNILTLTNRFEDILGVTIITNDTNRVEADLGNMETIITASPTPTLIIHKDHPKSQIIGPVDTPQVQKDGRTELHCHNPPEDKSSSSLILPILMFPISRRT